MPTFKTATQAVQIAPGKDARDLIARYRSRPDQESAVAAQATQNLQESIDALRRQQQAILGYLNYLIEQGAIGPPPPPAGVTITVTDQTLTSASTLITAAAPAASGDLLFLSLIQDGTGGRQITWDTNLKWATVNIPLYASSVSTFCFFAREDPADSNALNWFCFGQTLGNTP